MARNTRLIPYDEPAYFSEPAYGERTVESLDESATGILACGSTSSMAKRDYSLPDDIPLFLSNNASAANQRGFGRGVERDPRRTVVASRMVKAGLWLASIAAVALAILSLENPLALFASAKASLVGAQASATPKTASEPSIAARPAATRPAPPTSSPVFSAAPTRDEIAIALRAAHQRQTEIRQPAAAAAPPSRRLGADELTTLLKRAKSLIAIGDISAARLLLERAADAQEAGAALLLAQTWDPAVLGTPDARSITPDPAKARDWYQKAARLGSQDAQQRLSQLQN